MHRHILTAALDVWKQPHVVLSSRCSSDEALPLCSTARVVSLSGWHAEPRTTSYCTCGGYSTCARRASILSLSTGPAWLNLFACLLASLTVGSKRRLSQPSGKKHGSSEACGASSQLISATCRKALHSRASSPVLGKLICARVKSLSVLFRVASRIHIRGGWTNAADGDACRCGPPCWYAGSFW